MHQAPRDATISKCESSTLTRYRLYLRDLQQSPEVTSVLPGREGDTLRSSTKPDGWLTKAFISSTRAVTEQISQKVTVTS